MRTPIDAQVEMSPSASVLFVLAADLYTYLF